MKNFIGQDGFVWWIGIVESIDDPLTLGRCKVRCFGYHPAKKTGLVLTEDLPWAMAIHPVNTPNLYGTPKSGDWVFGFFLDSLSAQEPAILGYLPAIPAEASEYFGTAPDMTRNFANVTQKDSIVWDINGAKISLVNNTLLLHGKTELRFSDDVNNITLAEILDISNTVYAQANTSTALAQTAYAQANTSTELAQTAQENAIGPIDDRIIGATIPAAGTFTKINLVTETANSVFNQNYKTTGWKYSGNTFSIAAQESTATGLFFKSDGTKMYLNGSSGDDVNEYNLSTAWDITTASYSTVFSTATEDTAPQDIFFKPDGLTMFVIGSTNNTVYQYTLGTAWSVATASYASKSFSVAAQETTPTGLWFKPDGLVMYIIGSGTDTVYQYTLSTAWDISTASYASISNLITTQDSSPQQVNLSDDGLTMWILGNTTDAILQYSLATAWNISTATLVEKLYVGFEEATATGMFIDTTTYPNRVYMLGSSGDAIYQYNTNANSIKLDTEKLYVNGQLSTNGNFVAESDAFVDGTLTVRGATTLLATTLSTTSISGTLTATSTVTLGGATTSATSVGTTATTGTTTIGGTAQTGAITIGRSTAAQTLNLGTGSPASATTQAINIGTGAGTTTTASTKNINIGTGGITGTNTNVAIGSPTSGAISRTTLNGIVINSISAAVSAAGSTQATATALVSNINNVTVVAPAADGVILPTAVAGMRILVINNDAADTLKIYPATGAQINALALNASYSLLIGTSIEFVATTATQWYTR